MNPNTVPSGQVSTRVCLRGRAATVAHQRSKVHRNYSPCGLPPQRSSGRILRPERNAGDLDLHNFCAKKGDYKLVRSNISGDVSSPFILDRLAMENYFKDARLIRGTLTDVWNDLERVGIVDFSVINKNIRTIGQTNRSALAPSGNLDVSLNHY
jgi:hypothetical protein